jgi:uncharacterized RDD family membrane protein YckC
MQTIHVRTTQNVFIQYPVASLGDRILAYFLDSLIMIAYVALSVVLLMTFEINSIALIFGVILIPVMFYHLAFEIFMDGQSPGKRQMQIKVVRLDGTPPTIGNYIMRWMLRLIEIDVMSGAIAMIVIAVNGKGQRLGDVAAGTAVIKLVKFEATTARQVFTTPEDNYVPVYQQVTQLSGNDIELIQQALEVNRETGNAKPANAVAVKIQTLLGIQTDMPPVKFLYTVVKDYNHLTSRV